jgi:hypothetical protein
MFPWRNHRDNFRWESTSPVIFKMWAPQSFFTNCASPPSQIALWRHIRRSSIRNPAATKSYAHCESVYRSSSFQAEISPGWNPWHDKIMSAAVSHWIFEQRFNEFSNISKELFPPRKQFIQGCFRSSRNLYGNKALRKKIDFDRSLMARFGEYERGCSKRSR